MNKAVELAQGIVSANRNTRSFRGNDPTIHRLGGHHGGRTQPCFICGKTTHSPPECRFKDAECHACGKKGQLAPVCRSKPKTQTKGKPPSKMYPRKHAPHRVHEERIDSDDSGSEESRLYKFKETRPNPIQIPLKVEGRKATDHGVRHRSSCLYHFGDYSDSPVSESQAP